MDDGQTMKISVGNDHGGYDLTMSLIKFLQSNDFRIFYYGTFSKTESVDYPDYAERVAQDIISKKANFGILICKSGTGMAIAANKIRGIRAANCVNVKMAQLARKHNDANILCIGAEFVTSSVAKKITSAFIETDFEAGRHTNRIKKISNLEKAQVG